MGEVCIMITNELVIKSIDYIMKHLEEEISNTIRNFFINYVNLL